MKAEENMSETLNPTKIMIEPFFCSNLVFIGQKVWNDIGWCAATKGVEVQNDIGWFTTTKGVEVWNDKGSVSFLFFLG